MFDSLTNIPILKQVKGLLGGVFGFIEMYIFIFLLLFLAAFVPDSVDTGCDRRLEFGKLHHPTYTAPCELADGQSWIDKINMLPLNGSFF